jgi:nucleoside-diphosphate kinase
MVKPDGVRANHSDAIKEQIQAASFTIISQKWVHLNESAAITFYAEHSNRAFFPSLIDFMTRYFTFSMFSFSEFRCD